MNIFAKIKNEHHFTEGEKIFAEYILNHPRDIVQCDVQDIAKRVMFLFQRFIELLKN